ncbi:hypothetical protein ACROYT_G025915 [Oculina patagonica]
MSSLDLRGRERKDESFFNKVLALCNGRVTGDLDGKLTSYQTNGASTVDYGIVSEDLQDTVLGFQVQALTPNSDHCPITLKLASRNRDIINNASKNSQRKETSPQNSFTKFLWNLESKDKFISALSRIDIQDKLQSFNTAHHSSIDDEISQFNQILKSVAKRSLVPSRKTRKHTKKHKPWYDNTCRQLKKKLQKLVKEINPTAPQSLRQEYFAVKKKYKKLVKQMHKRYKNQLLNEINALKSNQSGDFWKLINKIRKNETVEESSDISSEDWINHFQNLLYDKAQESHGENVTSPNNPDQTTTKTDEILDAPITAKEIHDQISKLKNKKASGTDAILNEMIKHGRYYLMPSLERIFNDIIENGTFPTEWNIGVIKPIYKQKGDKKSPANYRGITLTSCLGKLFTSILQNRLNKFIEQHDVLNPEQFGFRPNSRTTDSLFIFQQLLHKYTKQHKKLYVGFIDYEKAFDSVDVRYIQPRPQSSPANLDVTSPAKLVGEVRLGRLAINGKSNMAEPVQRLNFSQLLEELKNASELGWDSFIHVCQQTREVIGDFLFKVEKLNVDFYAQQIVPSKELKEYVPLTVTGDGSFLYRSISLLVSW